MIYPIRKHPRSSKLSENMVLLENLLRSSAHANLQSNQRGGPLINRRDRLLIALILASTLLQLHPTPWLSKRWGKEHIRFLKQLGNTQEPLLTQPFIFKALTSSSISTLLQANQEESSSQTGPHIREESVFALGKLLVELSLNAPLEDMRIEQELGKDGKANQYTDWMAADRLLEDVYNQEGTLYGDAARRCIRCDFNQREESMENDEFRQAVFQGVVVPLQDHFRLQFGDPTVRKS
jgi:hypothetical protein